MIIDFKNKRCIITKSEIDELFMIDTCEDFNRAIEDMLMQVPDRFSAIPLYNYLKKLRGEEWAS